MTDFAKELEKCLNKQGKVVNKAKLEKLWESAAKVGHLAELAAAWDRIDPQLKETDESNQCETCDGLGREECDNCDGEGGTECGECGADKDCDECDGDGTIECSDCEGTGKKRGGKRKK